MSGGSFNYACDFTSLKDLLASKEELCGIASALRERGHQTAAAETDALVAELGAIEAYLLARAERLRQVWKATEWVTSGDWNEDDLAEDVLTLEAAPLFTDTARIDTSTGRVIHP